MRLLISPQQVIDLSFAKSDQITIDSIKDTKIDAAQEKFIRPVLGDLYQSLVEDKYTQLLEEYIQPALAYYVRYTIIPDLSLKLNDIGVQNPFTAHSNAATDKQRAELRLQAKDDANALLDKAIRYISDNYKDFPEYNPNCDVRKQVTMTGGTILF